MNDLLPRYRDLMACDIHQRIAALSGPPRELGIYRVRTSGGGNWHWEAVNHG